jgi:hypothetical protein
MSNENNEIQDKSNEPEVKLIEVSLIEFERQIDVERAYLIREGMNQDKARKKAKEIVEKKYIKVNVPIDYSNWAGQKE